jgi:PAS domain S-box-containing protein
MADGSSFQDSPEMVTSLPFVCEALFEMSEDGLCLLLCDAQIAGANRIFAEMVGLPLAQLIGRTFAEAFGQTPFVTQLAAFLLETRLTEHRASKEVSGHDGRRLRARLTPIINKQGRASAFLVVVREINDISAREREISRVEQRARFGELAAGLAHEIKNPLAGIQGAMDILISRRASDDEERNVLEGVKREVGRIDSTVRTLLDRARPRQLNIQPASVNETVERAVSLAQASLTSAHKDRIRFEVEAVGGAITLAIDAVQIEDAVLSLLLNAINAIDGIGVIKVRVYELPPDKEAGEVVIEITDTGCGIAAEDLTRIFSPFYTTDPAGTGLGLSAVRGIARAHGGRVDVSSEVRIGSTFSLRLPRQPLGKRFPIIN